MIDPRAVVLQILHELFADRCSQTIADMDDAAELQPTLDLDSMDVVDIAMELENRLDVEIEGKPSEIRTLGALLSEVRARL